MKINAITLAALAVAGLGVYAFAKRAQQPSPVPQSTLPVSLLGVDPWAAASTNLADTFATAQQQQTDSTAAALQNTNYLTGWGLNTSPALSGLSGY